MTSIADRMHIPAPAQHRNAPAWRRFASSCPKRVRYRDRHPESRLPVPCKAAAYIASHQSLASFSAPSRTSAAQITIAPRRG